MAARPKLYLLHGDDDFSRDQELGKVRSRAESGDLGGLNTTLLEGAQLELTELIHHCDTVPFLSERRLVIVRGYLASLPTDPRKQPLADFIAFVERMPESTALMLVEDQPVDASHPLARLARERPWGFEKAFQRPRALGALSTWIQQAIRQKGGQIEPAAAADLVAAVGNDLRGLDMELDKLLAYAAGRPVEKADVELLVPGRVEANIFALVDAVGEQNGSQAYAQLHHLLNKGENALRILSLIGRQIRLLLQLKDLRRREVDEAEVRRQLGVPPFVLRKLSEQVARFNLEEILAAHERVVETDWQIKRGRVAEETALDILIGEMTGGEMIDSQHLR